MEFNITTSMSQARDAVKDTDILKEVGPILADIERNFINLRDAKKTVDTESKGRKLEIRDTLKPRIVELEDDAILLQKKYDDLKNDSSSETLKTENKELQSFKSEVLTQRRTSFIGRFTKVAEHDKFEKVTDDFVLPEHTIEKDKKFDYSTLDFKDVSEDDMDKNVKMLNHLDKIEYFGEVVKTVDTDGDTTKKSSNTFDKKVKGAKTMKDLETIQEEESL